MNSPLKLLLVGDVMLGRLVNERLLIQQPLEHTATWTAGKVPETFPSGV